MNATRLPLAFLIILAVSSNIARADPPRSSDPNVKIELVAESPEIVTPVGCTVDKLGRLLVIESHTHFRPKDYVGPPADRIRIISDFDEHGRARKFTTFWEGSRATMNLAAAPDGSILVAARNEIFRLRDTKGTGVADEKTVLAHLDTKSEYPHNGLDSITLGRDGNIYFGIGENLGMPWKLIPANGDAIQDDGSNAGQIFVMDSSGGKLRRFSTGFWNPFGLTFDTFDRLIATDNDPDGRPPCRLVYVVPGGDYGYQYRYGRSGHHPLQGWDGELPGTLPPICGTGEAPCMLLQYRGKNLPAEYVNKFFVASWGDHRIEIYTLTERGAGFSATMKSLITGGDDFRPVGLAVAPDGSIFVTDWVDKSYQLHGKGRIWRIRCTEGGPTLGPLPDPPKPGEAMIKGDRLRYLHDGHEPMMDDSIVSEDVFIRQAATLRCTGCKSLEVVDWPVWEPRKRLGWLGAMRLSGDKKYESQLAKALQDPDPDIRFFATRWIADDRLTDYRAAIEKAMTEPVMTQRLFAAYLAALERLDGKGAFLGMPGTTMDQYLLRRIVDEKSPLTVRTMAMQMLPSQNKELKLDVVRELLKQDNEPLRTAAVRWLAASPDAERMKLLAEIADDNTYSKPLRIDAVVGLGGDPKTYRALLLKLMGSDLGVDVLRTLRPVIDHPPFPHPGTQGLNDWLRFADSAGGPADPEAGRRIFFNQAVAACAVCHTVDNRGSSIGPDLTMLGHSATRESLLKSILEPSAEIAPRYTLWSVTTRDGKTVTGMLTGHVPHNKTSDDEIYADAAGKETAIPSVEILTRTPLPNSLMPPNQLDTLTAEEIRDLLAFLLVKR